MRLSEMIANQIRMMLEEADGIAEIKRNEFAEKMGCVPSQINYVIDSRFTTEQGYIVESRRGGGGYIRITKVKMDRDNMLMHVVNNIGSEIDAGSSYAFLRNLLDSRLISIDVAHVMGAAVSDKAYSSVPINLRDILRASLLKNMLITTI